MGVIHRGEKSYVYFSEWIDGRCRTTYLGSGTLAEDCAAEWAEELQERREARNRARAERDAILALGEVVGQLAREACELAVAAMEAAGFHRPKGVWRRRRKRVSDESAKLATPVAIGAPASTGEARAEMEREILARISALQEDAKKGGPEAESKVCKYFETMQSAAPNTPLLRKILEIHGGNPAKAAEEAVIRRYAGEDLLRQEATRRSMDLFRGDLAGAGPVSAIEQVLIDRAAICWLASYDAEARAARTAFVVEGIQAAAEADFHQRVADRTSRRLLDVLKALDLVRRKAVPALQLNLTTGDIQVGANERPEPVADTAASRNLKIRA